MSKHTPGPWAAESEGSIVAVESGRDAGRVIVELARADGRSVGGTKAMDAAMEANARLIAAAPELLEALQALEWAVDGVAYIQEEYAEQVAKARAAIAKATGSTVD